MSRIRSMFEEEWRPVVGFRHWEVSNQGRVRNDFSGFVLTPFVKNGDIYVELTNSNGQYVDIRLAVILLTSFPEDSKDDD